MAYSAEWDNSPSSRQQCPSNAGKQGGLLFAQISSNNNWYVFLNYDWFLVGSNIPAGPIPIAVTLGTTLQTGITTKSPLGTVVSTISTTMSDGSTFSGSYSVSMGSGETWVGISGSNIVSTGTPVVEAAGCTVTASQNGVSIAAGACVVDVVVSS